MTRQSMMGRESMSKRQPAQPSSRSSLDLADQFALQPTFTPALPSQRERLQHALRLLAGIAVRMGQPDHPLPPRDLTGSPTEAMNVEPSHAEGEGSN